MREPIENYLEKHQQAIALVREHLVPQITECALLMAAALRDGKKILLMGNGGSAADAQHFAAEMVGRFLRERRGLPAIALTTDTSILTAVGNDYGFDRIFSRQVEALAQPGDVVVGISTSGNSRNVLAAMTLAEELGCRTVGLLGQDGGVLAEAVSLAITVPVRETPHVQEAHITIIHMLCDLIESRVGEASN